MLFRWARLSRLHSLLFHLTSAVGCQNEALPSQSALNAVCSTVCNEVGSAGPFRARCHTRTNRYHFCQFDEDTR
jgi:hypothetical protein